MPEALLKLKAKLAAIFLLLEKEVKNCNDWDIEEHLSKAADDLESTISNMVLAYLTACDKRREEESYH